MSLKKLIKENKELKAKCDELESKELVKEEATEDIFELFVSIIRENEGMFKLADKVVEFKDAFMENDSLDDMFIDLEDVINSEWYAVKKDLVAKLKSEIDFE